MNTTSIFVIVLLASSISASVHRRRLQNPSFPGFTFIKNKQDCLKVFEDNAKEANTKNFNAQKLYDDSKKLLWTPSELPYAVVINFDNEPKNIEACHNSFFCIQGCNQFKLLTLKPIFVSKRQACIPMFENKQIMIKENNVGIQVMLEGMIYTMHHGAFGAIGSVKDLKHIMRQNSRQHLGNK